MKISFVIPAYNEEEYLPRCLASIRRELETASLPAEIIVVNNASTDGTARVAAGDPLVRVVEEPRKGIVWARQRGLLAAEGELIANIDADVELLPGWLAKVSRKFDRQPGLVCLSGPFRYKDLPVLYRGAVFVFYLMGLPFHLIFRSLRMGAMVQGGNFVLRRSAFERAGGYDTSIQFYGEDTEVGRRLVKFGRVEFSFDLPVLSSGRRLCTEGILRTGLRYAINFLWITLLRRPYHQDSVDIRGEERYPRKK